MANTIDTYTSLVTSEHQSSPKYMAWVAAMIEPIVVIQDVINNIVPNFDVDTAIGVQLDIVGLWVGMSRVLKVPVTGVYYTVEGTEEEGVGRGILRGVFDDGNELYVLGDNSYRLLIKAKIVDNHWNGTILGAYEIWNSVFGPPAPGTPSLYLQDNQDMTMTIGIYNVVLNTLEVALLMGGYIDIRPEGVRIREYLIVPGEAPIGVWGNPNSLWGETCWAITVLPE